MRSPSLFLGSLVLALFLQPLLAQTHESQPSKLDLARTSGFDFGRISELTRGDKSAMASLINSGQGNSALIQEPKHPQFFPAQPNLPQTNNDLCYRLQVYHFTREGTEAPRMTGSTTCTPANRMAFKNVDGASGPAPKARYVPQ